MHPGPHTFLTHNHFTTTKVLTFVNKARLYNCLVKKSCTRFNLLFLTFSAFEICVYLSHPPHSKNTVCFLISLPEGREEVITGVLCSWKEASAFQAALFHFQLEHLSPVLSISSCFGTFMCMCLFV